MLLFLPEPWEIRKDHQDPANRPTKSPAYLIRDYSFDVGWADFDACVVVGFVVGFFFLDTEQLPLLS